MNALMTCWMYLMLEDDKCAVVSGGGVSCLVVVVVNVEWKGEGL